MRRMMTRDETIFLKALYEKGKTFSKPPQYIAYLYSLSDILQEINLQREDVVGFLKDNPNVDWVEPEGVRLTADGLVFCQEEFERKPPMGFIKD